MPAEPLILFPYASPSVRTEFLLLLWHFCATTDADWETFIARYPDLDRQVSERERTFLQSAFSRRTYVIKNVMREYADD